MRLSTQRSVVIIAGLLTVIVLGSGSFAVALHNGQLRFAPDPSNRGAAAANAAPQRAADEAAPVTGRPEGEVGVYRQRLEEAYQALDDAYAQIRALQAPQLQLASARGDDDRFEEHESRGRRERRSGRREPHDE